MKIYIKNDLLNFEGENQNIVLPTGTYELYFLEGDTVASLINTHSGKLIFWRIPITDLKKENGIAYTDKADLLAELKDFFFINDLWILENGIIQPKDDNDLLLTGRFLPVRRKHGYYGFEDIVLELAVIQNVWTKVTNATNDLFEGIQENAGFSIENDTFKLNADALSPLYSAHVRFDFQLTGYSLNGQNWELAIFNKTRDTFVNLKSFGTTIGDARRNTFASVAYDLHAEFGHEYEMQIRCTTGNRTFETISGGVFMEASHLVLK